MIGILDVEKELAEFLKRELKVNPFLGERSINELSIGFVEGVKVALFMQGR